MRALFARLSHTLPTTRAARCIDEYTRARVQASSGEVATSVDPRLEAVVHRMFERCWADGAYRSALGVALESHRLDLVETTLRRAVSSGARVPVASVRTHASVGGGLGTASAGLAPQPSVGQRGADATVDFLGYGYDLACSSAVVPSRAFRQEVLRVLVKLHQEQPDDGVAAGGGAASGGWDHTALCRCLQALNDAPAVAGVLVGLVQRGTAASPAAWSNHPAVLLAMQVCFDVVDAESQDFAVNVYTALPAGASSSSSAAGGGNAADDVSMAEEGGSAGSSPRPFDAALDRLKSILDGSVPCALALDFLR